MTQAPATPSLVERLRDPDYAGPFQHLRSWTDIDALFGEAADALEAQQARIAELEGVIDAARDELREFEHVAGEPLSETAGVAASAFGHLKHRANSAQALADRYEKALKEIAALDRHSGSSLRTRAGSEIARQALSSSQGRHEGGETGSIPELPGVNAVPLPASPDGLLSDPSFVHLNMLRGGIAKLMPAQIGHLYRGAEAAEVIAEVLRQNPAVQPTDALYGLVNAARRHMATHPVFRTRRIGGEGSRARLEQEDQIASEDALRAAIHAALLPSPNHTNPEAEHG